MIFTNVILQRNNAVETNHDKKPIIEHRDGETIRYDGYIDSRIFP